MNVIWQCHIKSTETEMACAVVEFSSIRKVIIIPKDGNEKEFGFWINTKEFERLFYRSLFSVTLKGVEELKSFIKALNKCSEFISEANDE